MATLHDPRGVALSLIDLELEAITTALGRYPLVIVATSPATDARVTTRLEQLGIHVVPGGQAGEGRRAALTAARGDQLANFSCDFDRWLHWARFWPDEMAALPARVARLGSGRRISPWYVCLGRTARAFATHPAAQRLPETATNRALSAAAGRPLDAVAGAAWLTPEAAKIILAGSREPTAATDLEWPALILQHDPSRLRGLRCEGLEWETPDFHAAEIMATGGLAAWTRAIFDTHTMWAARLRLAAASGAALERVLSNEPRLHTDPLSYLRQERGLGGETAPSSPLTPPGRSAAAGDPARTGTTSSSDPAAASRPGRG
ncbi:MAG: hypothetical protein K0Q89_2726 [Thermomicrobiales bacterium]|nr:hypothetical protein [Thermomicrobiales bacterium]